jgi:Zn-dependent protease
MILSLLQMDLPMNIMIGLLVIHLFCVIMALTLHEFAHGYAAYKMGDPTAKQQGRLSLNPMAHLDPVGFLMMLLVGFGWAKPVPINTYQMRNPRKGLGLTALAGPAINLCLAMVSGIIAGLLAIPAMTSGMENEMSPIFVAYYFMSVLSQLNIGLALFNLIPLPPLDGSNIVVSLLPPNVAAKYLQIRYYTRYIFLGIMIISILADRIALFARLDYIIWYPFMYVRGLLSEWFVELGFRLYTLFL